MGTGITILICAPGIALGIYMLWQGWRDQKFDTGPMVMSRARRPGHYWTNMVFVALLTLGLAIELITTMFE